MRATITLIFSFFLACTSAAHAGTRSSGATLPRVIESFQVGENTIVRALTAVSYTHLTLPTNREV